MVKTNKKVDKREAHIKKKLTAAVMMLLISCIMTVTSTYAWFTLSTAPEITGVSTTVGANGSLEIALAKTTTWNGTEDITSDVGDSGDFTSWGNMVDLSSSEFGLNNIKLYPAELNSTTTGEGDDKVTTVPLTTILRTPIYGVDGRVSTVSANTVTGIYDGQSFIKDDAARGVRAIGRSTNMTARQSAYRSALDSILIYQTAASSALKTSWVNNGGHLSSLAIGIVGGSADTTAISQQQHEAVGNLLTALEEAVAYLDKSMTSAIDGYLASAAMANDNTLKVDEAYLAIHNELITDGYKLLSHIQAEENDTVIFSYGSGSTAGTVTLSGDIADQLKELVTIDTNVKAARTAYPGTYDPQTTTIGVMKTSLSHLINVVESEENSKKVSTVTVGGHTPSELQQFASDKTVGPIIDDLTVSLNKGSGVYYSISEFIGNFSANVKIPENSNVTVGSGENMMSVNLAGMTVVMKSNYTGSLTKLEIAKNAVTAQGEPSSTNSAEASVISDYYGYALDFFVRTNASNSSLLLSTNAVNRVGGENASEETMGGGSTMKINSMASDISVDTMKGLLNCMRVVFVDGTGTLLAEARFDTSTFTDGENVDLKIWDSSITKVLTCKDETHTTESQHGDSCYTSSNGAFSTTNSIVELPTNTPYKLTAIVYLDGASIDNADVSNAATSFIGTLNLQFASSATLVPMSYSDYQPLPSQTPSTPSDTKTEAELPEYKLIGTVGAYTGFKFDELPSVGKIMYQIDDGAETEYTTEGTEVDVAAGSTVKFWVDVEDTNPTTKDSTPVTYDF